MWYATWHYVGCILQDPVVVQEKCCHLFVSRLCEVL